MDEAPDERTGFLPPQPAGPEPELGGRPAPLPPAPPQPQPQAQPTYGYPPPPPGAPPAQGWQPPQQGAAQPQQGWQPPAPGWQQPPGYWQQPPGQAYPPQWGPAQPAPDNNPAVAGFVLSVVAGGLLFVSGGLSSLLSVGLAIPGIVYSRKGKRKVDAGETPRHRGLAQAGFIVGWVSLALAVLATIFWVVMLIVAINDPDAFDDSQTITAVLRSLGA